MKKFQKNQKYEFLKKETHQNSGHNSIKNFITVEWVSSTHPDLSIQGSHKEFR